MILNYKKSFIKQLKKAPSPIKNKLSSRITLFADNPFHPLLNNHILTGKYKNCHSINITGDWRAIYTPIDKNNILFIAFGTHSQLYK